MNHEDLESPDDGRLAHVLQNVGDSIPMLWKLLSLAAFLLHLPNSDPPG